MAGKIFINYRRSLNLVEAQLLKKVLQRHFGKDGVFLDVSGLEGGQHWLHSLEAQVDAAAAMVSLIPKGWAAVADETGARRLDNPDDFVRFEIARAFSRRIPLVPLLLDGASMPGVAELPLNLVQLSFQQGMLLRGESFDDDGDKIARRLKELIAPERKLSYWAAGAVATAALLAGLAAGPPVLTGLGIVQPSTDTALRKALAGAQRQAADAEAARKEAEAARKAAEAKYAEAADELGRAQAASKAAQDELAATQEKGEAAGARVAELTGRLQSAEQALKEAKPAVQKAQADVAAANGRADRAEAALKQRAATPTGNSGQRAGDAPENASATGKAGETFKDCSDCPEMVLVPKGEFMMGSPQGEAERYDNESPQHKVTISKPFAVGKYDVTFDEWEACVSGGGCTSNRNPSDQGWGKGKRPVINVTWAAAREYVQWLSRKTGKDYRLLTEAEWEYAARARTQTRYYWGNDVGRGKANCNGCGSQWDGKQTAEVGQFQPNDFGLYDMAGNVWQWTEDCWNENYNNAHGDGSALTTGDCSRRVIRGGSWNDSPWFLRAAARNRRSGWYFYVGFRVART